MRALVAAALVALTAAAGAVVAGETASDSRRLDLTIYANGLALVRDSRPAALAAGVNRLAFAGVSPKMIADSALVAGGDGLSVTAVDYDFDLLTPDALLRRAVGQEVGVVRTNPTGGEETTEPATVLSVDGGVVLRYRDRVETGVPGRLVFDAVPDGLHPQPTLVASIHAEDAREARIDLSYLTGGLSWRADYVAVVADGNGDAGDDAGARVALSARAIVENTSGTDFTDATIGLVAGDVRRVSPPAQAKMRAGMRGEMMPMAADAAMSPPPPEALGQLHLYALPAPTGLRDRQTRQFALMDTRALPVERTYVSEQPAWAFERAPGATTPTHPAVTLSFVNPSSDAEGLPLPAGIARIYARDGGGSLRLLGEDTIPDTPAGGRVRLAAGTAFDVTVERRQSDFKRADLPDGVFESAWAIKAANAKSRPVSVRIVEAIPGDWEILSESAQHEKTRADRAVWTLDVPARGEATLDYRVRVRQ